MEKGGLRKPYTIKDDYAKHECNQQGKNDPAIVIENINSNSHKSSKISRQNQQIRFGNIPSPIIWITRHIIIPYRVKNLHLFCISSNACLNKGIDNKLTTSKMPDSNQMVMCEHNGLHVNKLILPKAGLQWRYRVTKLNPSITKSR